MPADASWMPADASIFQTLAALRSQRMPAIIWGKKIFSLKNQSATGLEKHTFPSARRPRQVCNFISFPKFAYLFSIFFICLFIVVIFLT
jgi:hypothetical protein